jgi:hypothetical protein
MAKHRFTRAQKEKGWRKALKNPRTPAGLKKWIRRQLR